MSLGAHETTPEFPSYIITGPEVNGRLHLELRPDLSVPNQAVFIMSDKPLNVIFVGGQPVIDARPQTIYPSSTPHTDHKAWNAYTCTLLAVERIINSARKYHETSATQKAEIANVLSLIVCESVNNGGYHTVNSAKVYGTPPAYWQANNERDTYDPIQWEKLKLKAKQFVDQQLEKIQTP